MIRTTALSLVVAAAVAIAAAGTAEAAPIPSVAVQSASSFGWGFGVSIGSPGHRVIHPHVVPTVQYVQEPIYRNVLVGYDSWGNPIFDTVLVGYRTVPIQSHVVYPHVHRTSPSWRVGFGWRR